MTEPAKVAGGEALPLRLKWRQTWPDKEADFTAHASNYDHVGRFYLHEHEPQKGRWSWSLTAFGDGISRNIGACHGFADSAREAAYAVETAWFAAIKGSKLDQPEPKRNAYKLAKAGE